MSLKKRVEDLLVGKKNGQTLLERAFQKGGPKTERPEDQIYNPLQVAIHDLVELRFEEAGTYEVIKLTELATRVNEQAALAVRYVLQDASAADDELLMLELIQTAQPDHPEQYLFVAIDSFAYEEEFTVLLDDDVFVVTEDVDGVEIEKEYEKKYHVTAQTRSIQKDRSLISGTAETWNYEFVTELETSYLVIEMDGRDGWFSIYEGRKLLEGEMEIYPLTADAA